MTKKELEALVRLHHASDIFGKRLVCDAKSRFSEKIEEERSTKLFFLWVTSKSILPCC